MDLLLTLGHNSSCVGVVDGCVVAGYEEERLSRVKSDSSAPVRALAAVLDVVSPVTSARVFVSHWFDSYQSEAWPAKYWAAVPTLLAARSIAVAEFHSLSPGLTHHDAHAWSALSFSRCHGHEPEHVVVADGFGNNGEVVTTYAVRNGRPEPLRRVRGHEKSLGLMYQYATSFVGMKEHEDEWKFLGYESRIRSVLDSAQIEALRVKASLFADSLYAEARPVSTTLASLPFAKDAWRGVFLGAVMSAAPCKDQYTWRAVLGHFVQSVLEAYYGRLLDGMRDCAFAGGVHYNVKLNNEVSRFLDSSSFCPLAGDQGAAIGLYSALGNRFDFTGLRWGKRDLSGPLPDDADVHRFADDTSAAQFIASQVLSERVVNVVRGPAEFGPRALCNTSTFCLPLRSCVDHVNALNGRDTVMPFAPIVLPSAAEQLFTDSRVVGSLDYMVCAVDYRGKPPDRYLGVAHEHPLGGRWSGRPQVVHDDPFVEQLLELVAPRWLALVNTSFNVHGCPIVHSLDDAVSDWRSQCKIADSLSVDRPLLVVVG